MNRFILSLGTNCEPRIDHLKTSLLKLSSFCKLLKIAPIFENAPLLPPNAPSSWYQFFYNSAVLIESLLPAQEVLKKCQEIEEDLGRTMEREKWSPRTIDIDLIFELANNILVSHKSDALTLPHPEWRNRNFILAPLLHLLPSLSPAQDILKIHRGQKMPLTAWVPILNATPDSFSEKPNEIDLKLQQLKSFLNLHPAFIDIGAESTRHGAIPVSPEQEWQRLDPLLSYWREHKHQFPFTQISIDTRHAQTAQKAHDYGVSILNDVNGLSLPEMREVAEDFAQVILMHSLTVPADPKVVLAQSEHPVDVVLQWAKDKKDSFSPTLQKKLIFDPGIGFGKTPHQSLQILQNIKELHALELPLLIGHSRKSFMNLWSREAFFERDPETFGVSSFLYGKVEFLRIHNLDAHQKMERSLLAMRGSL